jgi:CBS domain-containing protein
VSSIEKLRATKIEELTTEADFVSEELPISKVIGKMRDLDIYEIFVQCGERIGIINVRSILEATHIATTKAGSIALFPPRVAISDSVGKVSEFMGGHRLRSIPVWEGRRVVGQINALTIVSSLVDCLSESLKATHVMTENPTTITGSSSVSKAKNLMVRRRIDHLPVVQQERPRGMLTSSHLIFQLTPAESIGSDDRVGETLKGLDFPVQELMDVNIEISPLDQSAVALLKNMIELGKTYSLVGLWEELQGIVTYRDFMRLLEHRREPTEIPITILGLPDDPFESEIVKTKFNRVVSLIRRVYPQITEARSIIKVSSFSARRGRKHYEVSVTLKTPRDLFSYSEKGWDLAKIYDILSDRLKRLLSRKRKRRRPRTRLKEQP